MAGARELHRARIPAYIAEHAGPRTLAVIDEDKMLDVCDITDTGCGCRGWARMHEVNREADELHERFPWLKRWESSQMQGLDEHKIRQSMSNGSQAPEWNGRRKALDLDGADACKTVKTRHPPPAKQDLAIHDRTLAFLCNRAAVAPMRSTVSSTINFVDDPRDADTAHEVLRAMRFERMCSIFARGTLGLAFDRACADFDAACVWPSERLLH